MPLLDLQVKIEQKQVIYKFYSKPMSTPFLMLAKSAMPDKMKWNCLVQEAIRRLRNKGIQRGSRKQNLCANNYVYNKPFS